jgi:hypothetical protein
MDDQQQERTNASKSKTTKTGMLPSLLVFHPTLFLLFVHEKRY